MFQIGSLHVCLADIVVSAFIHLWLQNKVIVHMTYLRSSVLGWICKWNSRKSSCVQVELGKNLSMFQLGWEWSYLWDTQFYSYTKALNLWFIALRMTSCNVGKTSSYHLQVEQENKRYVRYGKVFFITYVPCIDRRHISCSLLNCQWALDQIVKKENIYTL